METLELIITWVYGISLICVIIYVLYWGIKELRK